MDRLRQDLYVALRGFRRTPTFFVTAVVILGLGIGMSVAMFTVFRAVLIRRLPVVDQDRIAVMWTYREPTVEFSAGTKQLAVLRRESRTMKDVAGVVHWPANASPMLDGTRPLALNRSLVTGNFFDVLGAHAVIGRLLHSSDDDVGAFQTNGNNASKSLVLSYTAWQRDFNGDPSIVGRHITEPLLNWQYTVVGVAPPGLNYPEGVDFWIPMWGGWTSDAGTIAVARLAPGATLAAARNEYFGIAARELPEAHFTGVNAKSFSQTVLGDISPILSVLVAAVGLLLLIACINVGNLLLLRASSRTREIAVRRALGAGYGDIVRQLLVEAAALAVVGGVLGYVIARLALKLLITFAPPQLPRLDDVQLAGTPVLSVIAITTLCVLLFGVVPSFIAARTNLASPLRSDSRSGNETRQRRFVRQTLVASQVALAMIMLGAAGLLARSLERLERQDLGYTSDHLSILSFTYDATKYGTQAQLNALGDQLISRLHATPGVTAVTPLLIPPLLGPGVWQFHFQKEGESDADAALNPATPVETGGFEFFKALGIPLIAGRPFVESDNAAGPLVVVISESVARKYWPGENAVGKRLRLTRTDVTGGMGWRTIVGVAHETHLRSLRDAAPTVYLPWQQSLWQNFIAIRSTSKLPTLLPSLRRAFHEVDPRIALWEANTMDQLLAEPLSQPRLSALLMSAFGLVALMLAAIGLYGVMASLVRDQTREIGIRIALGATSNHVRREVLRRAAIVTGSGAIVGLVAALACSRLLASLLFHVSPADPLVLGAAVLVLLAVGALSAYLPARRATRIDPVEALRAD